MKKQLISALPLITIILFSFFLRLYGLNWDQNHHLHPDERFLTMVANAIKWPSSVSEYLNTNQSPLNPHNMGHGFFVYGTFPLFLVKWVAESLQMGDYNRLTLVGRAISAIFDVGTVVVVYLAARELFVPGRLGRPGGTFSIKLNGNQDQRNGNQSQRGGNNNISIEVPAIKIIHTFLSKIKLISKKSVPKSKSIVNNSTSFKLAMDQKLGEIRTKAYHPAAKFVHSPESTRKNARLSPLVGKNSISATIPLLASFSYAISVLPIQLSHFFAVDTFLVFFLTLSFYFLLKIIGNQQTQSLKLNGELRIMNQESRGKKKIIHNSLFPIYASRSSVLRSRPKLCHLKFAFYAMLLGISYGLALSSKISALLFLPIIILGLLFIFIKNFLSRPLSFSLLTSHFLILTSLFLLLISSIYFTIRLAYPYLFSSEGQLITFKLNHKVIDNWEQLKSFDNPNANFPPAVQWIKTKPYIYPLKNIILWGLGLPLGMLSVAAVAHTIATLLYCYIAILKNWISANHSRFSRILSTKLGIKIRGNSPSIRGNPILLNYWKLTGLSLITIWVVLLFAYQGAQFSKAMRYFAPIYPFLAILTAWFTVFLVYRMQMIIQITKFKALNFKFLTAIFNFSLVIFNVIYPLSFISIYSRPHSRIAASTWIYENIPAGSTLATEHWDDGLPLNLSVQKNSSRYKSLSLPLYDPDTEEKWRKIIPLLKKTDYILLTSNRLYGSIMTVPERYPITYRYYQALFDGSLGFEKIAEFTSRPNILLPNLQLSTFNFSCGAGSCFAGQLSTPHLCLTPPLARYGIVAKPSQECPLSGISFVDDYADESFTVYDHPKVIIFRKKNRIDLPAQYLLDF